VIVPELRALPLAGGRRRMAGSRSHGGSGQGRRRRQDAIVLGNGYGGFVALQMAIRHPGIAAGSSGPIAVRRFRKRARGVSQHGRPSRPRLVGDHRCGDAASVRAGFSGAHPDLMADRRAAFLRTDLDVFCAACDALAGLDLRPDLGRVKSPVSCWSVA